MSNFTTASPRDLDFNAPLTILLITGVHFVSSSFNLLALETILLTSSAVRLSPVTDSLEPDFAGMASNPYRSLGSSLSAAFFQSIPTTIAGFFLSCPWGIGGCSLAESKAELLRGSVGGACLGSGGGVSSCVEAVVGKFAASDVNFKFDVEGGAPSAASLLIPGHSN